MSAWHSVAQGVTSPVAQAFESIEERLTGLVRPLANLAYVVLMLYGFAKLPANFMLAVGVVTVFFGPSALIILFKLFGIIVSHNIQELRVPAARPPHQISTTSPLRSHETDFGRFRSQCMRHSSLCSSRGYTAAGG